MGAPRVTPDDLPNWVPGEVTGGQRPRLAGSRAFGFAAIAMLPWTCHSRHAGLHHRRLQRTGRATMNRRSTGEWRKELVAPGCVSLLTHAAQSHWRWSEDIEVTHLYLSPGAMADVAAEAYDCHIKDVELRDIFKADDPVLAGIAGFSGARGAEARSRRSALCGTLLSA